VGGLDDLLGTGPEYRRQHCKQLQEQQELEQVTWICLGLLTLPRQVPWVSIRTTWQQR